jgi:hypothetical protein
MIMDIELLLQWAINNELPKGHHVMKPVWKIVEEHAGSRSGIGLRETLSPTAGGTVPGEPDPDATVVAKVLKGFDHRYGLSAPRAHGLVRDLVKIDHYCITAATVTHNLYALLVSCAISKRPPACDGRMPRPRPLKREGDRVLWLEDSAGDLVAVDAKDWREGDFSGAPRCPLIWDDPRPKDVAEQRATYTLWRMALTRFADKLNSLPLDRRMKHHITVRPQRPERPWARPLADRSAALAA